MPLTFLALTGTSHARKLSKWLARSYIFVIAAGVILMLANPASDYTYFGGWLIIGLGAAWGITRLWYSMMLPPSKSTRQARSLRLWLENSYLLFIAAGTTLFFAAAPIGRYYWVESNMADWARFIDVELAGYAIYVTIFGVALGIIQSLLSGPSHRYFTEKKG